MAANSLGTYLTHLQDVVAVTELEQRRVIDRTNRKRRRAAQLPEDAVQMVQCLGDAAKQLLTVGANTNHSNNATALSSVGGRWTAVLPLQECVLDAVATHRTVVNRTIPKNTATTTAAAPLSEAAEQQSLRKQLVTGVFPHCFRHCPTGIVAIQRQEDEGLQDGKASQSNNKDNGAPLKDEVEGDDEKQYTQRLGKREQLVTPASASYVALQAKTAAAIYYRRLVTDTKLRVLEEALPRLYDRIGKTRARVLARCGGVVARCGAHRPWIEFEAVNDGVVRVAVRGAVRVDLIFGAPPPSAAGAAAPLSSVWLVHRFHWTTTVKPSVNTNLNNEKRASVVAADLGRYRPPAEQMIAQQFERGGFEEGLVALLQAVSGMWADLAFEQCTALVEQHNNNHSQPNDFVATIGRQAGTSFTVAYRSRSSDLALLSQFFCEEFTVLHVRTKGTDVANRLVWDALSEVRDEDVGVEEGHRRSVLCVDAQALVERDWAIMH